jgi:S-formylglutathione hydrolase FrmB
MALLTCDFFSEALELGTSITVVLPQPTVGQVGVDPGADADAPPPLLYLLHGRSDDHTAWLRYTSIERYATAAGVAVVMPAVARSFYADEAHGHRYWTYLSEELPTLVHRFFRVGESREQTFVAGLSMGGYGALKWAFHQPERFAAAASLSGAVDVVGFTRDPERRDELVDRVYGGEPGPGEDLYALLDKADPEALPDLYLSCGTEDFLHDDNVRFVEALRARGLDPVVDFRPGEHEWGFWDTDIQRVLAWLPLPGRAG